MAARVAFTLCNENAYYTLSVYVGCRYGQVKKRFSIVKAAVDKVGILTCGGKVASWIQRLRDERLRVIRVRWLWVDHRIIRSCYIYRKTQLGRIFLAIMRCQKNPPSLLRASVPQKHGISESFFAARMLRNVSGKRSGWEIARQKSSDRQAEGRNNVIRRARIDRKRSRPRTAMESRCVLGSGEFCPVRHVKAKLKNHGLRLQQYTSNKEFIRWTHMSRQT
jgi:hypothetical protein